MNGATIRFPPYTSIARTGKVLLIYLFQSFVHKIVFNNQKTKMIVLYRTQQVGMLP
jgi:hypothetical protein